MTNPLAYLALFQFCTSFLLNFRISCRIKFFEILKNDHKGMHVEHQLAIILKIFQMSMTLTPFLQWRAGSHILSIKQNSYALFSRLKYGRRENIKMKNREEKRKLFFLFYSQETGFLEKINLKMSLNKDILSKINSNNISLLKISKQKIEKIYWKQS